MSESKESNSIFILSTNPSFVYDGINYTDGDHIQASMLEDESIEFELFVQDPDHGQSFSWYISNATNGYGEFGRVMSTDSKIIRYIPNENYYGTSELVITVDDNVTRASSDITFDITIDPINDAPINTSIPLVTGIFLTDGNIICSTGTWNDYADNPNPGDLFYSYQWQISDDNYNFEDINGLTSYVITVPWIWGKNVLTGASLIGSTFTITLIYESVLKLSLASTV